MSPTPATHSASSASPKAQSNGQGAELVTNSLLYREFLAEREEILRHKWIESEKAGHDVGFEKALLDWILRYRSNWRLQRQQEAGAEQAT